ncbi:hypothetical protein K0M31_018120 [Melipona bicolor]|uniref:Uncharacterized protein n=1 Tax=Melipona bicolor TaxID=60889 RepID=A0AA40KE47_9HYME|nr:hypothetical protein K0M31_018120 [Melipona bicolor]
MSTTWIRNNMLHIDDKCDRKLTEAELRVERFPQRLSIPDWYLNKYTSSSKLLNTKPFESRTLWKNFSPQKNRTLDSFSSLSDVERSLNEKTQNAALPVTKMPIDKNTCHEQKLPSTNRKRRASKEEEIFDIDHPTGAKQSKKNCKTFPKKSPSRKISNLNLVLPPGPKIDISKEFETYLNDDDNLFAKKLQASKKQKISKQNDATEKSRQKENVSRVPTPIKLAHTEFDIRATSTPKPSFVRTMSGPKKLKKVPCDLATKDFSTSQQDSMNRAMNLLNRSKNISKSRRLSPNILEKTSIFENSELNSLDYSYARTSSDKFLLERNIQSNDSVRAKASIFESNSSLDHSNFNQSYIISSSKKQKLLPMADVRPSKSVREKTSIYESNSTIDKINAESSFNKLPRRNIRLTELVREKAAFFESNISLNSCDQSCVKPSSNKALSTKNNQTIDSGMNNFDQSYAETSSESLNIRSGNSSTRNLFTPIECDPLIHKLIKLEDSHPPRSELRKKRISRYDAIRSINIEAKMLTADKKLPNICSREKRINLDEQWSYIKFLGLKRKNRQSNRENSVQEIIQNFEKARISESRCSRSSELNEDFVRQLVDVKEGDTSAIKMMTHPDEEDNCSELETKSYVTSTFFENTDTSIDTNYDQRPPTPKCDKKRYGVEKITTGMANLTVETEKKTEEEGDNIVYWIPIRRKLPASSSLLSVVSKISSSCYSPCISPIKDEDDVEFSQQATCETTSKEENVAKKPSKIDETVIIDSGYSDRSERSVLNSVPSAANNIWYDNSESKRKLNIRRKWSPKPISIAGYTYCVQ